MGKNKNVGCGCDYCMSRGPRRDFRHGAVDESDFEEVDYRPRSKKNGCKKSKTGEPCEFDVKHYQIRWQFKILDRPGWSRYYAVQTCLRCGKHGHYFSFTGRD